MSNKDRNINVLTDLEKVEFLKSIEGKGEKLSKEWKLIHSEICGPDEADLDLKDFVANLDAHKFAVKPISNPNLSSFMDRGLVKVRYRYVLDPAHTGEEAIKDNTREFCETLIRQDLIYRREDINAMSFAGTNPIAKQNYSIFKLQGHWNCRHAWQREIYVLTARQKVVKNGKLTETQIAMSTNKKGFLVALGTLLSEWGDKLTKEDIVKANELMLKDQKFVDIDVDGKVLRIDADAPEVGAAVSWVDAEGNLTDVENGELPVLIDEKPSVLVIEDRVIKEIKDVAATEEGDNAEQQMSAEEGAALRKELSDLKEGLPAMIADAVKSGVSEKFSAIDKEIKNLPAFIKDEISTSLSEDKGGTEEKKISLAAVVSAKSETE